MKKRRKFFQRAAALLCCIVLLSSLVAVPVHAADDSEFFDVLEFCTANDSGSQVVSGSLPMSVIYRTVQEPFRYIDMVVITDIADLFITYAGYDLTTVLIGTNYGYIYRVYGNLVGDPSGYLAFTVGGSSGSWISFESLRVSSYTVSQEYYPSVGGLYAYYTGSGDITYMSDPDAPVTKTFFSNGNEQSYNDFNAAVYVSEWKKFDYVDVLIQLRVNSISSILCSIDNTYIPYSISYLDGDFEVDSGTLEDDYYVSTLSASKVLIRLDLREINKTNIYYPMISINGMYEDKNAACSITLTSVTGYVVAESSSPLGTFWKNLVSTLNQLFGNNDPEAAAAQQTQEEVDYEINLQIVEAMNEWDNNIQYAETGFGSGLSFVSPSVAWISTLASRIFTNMGGFSALYILAGFMSVIMLLLSKSGIASKISNIGRSKK